MERINGKTRALLAGLAALAACASMAWSAPLAANLYVGTLKDLNGFDGRPVPDGSYIEFRKMYKAGMDWITYSPESPRLLETRNPLKATSKVGCGVIPSARGRGLFAACVPGLEKGTQYVVRVFSGPTPEESVAYCDSRPFTYTAEDTRSVTNVTFGIWTAMDGSLLEDTDGDGLVDLAEETVSGTKPDVWDTDGDGFSDGFEYSHYMSPTNRYMVEIQLAVTPVRETLQGEGEGAMSLYDVTWESYPGVMYRLEYQPSMVPAEPDESWTAITNVKALGTNIGLHLEDLLFKDQNLADSPSGFFRVQPVPEPNGQATGE